MDSYISKDEQNEDVVKKSKFSDLQAFMHILKYSYTYWKYYLAGIALTMLATMALLYSAKVIGDFVENGLMKSNKELAYELGYWIIALECIGILFQWFGRIILAKGASKTILCIREELFKHLQLLPMSFYDRQPQGRIVTRVTHDVEGMENFFVTSLGRLLGGIFMALNAIIAMCLTKFDLGITLLLSIIPAILFIYFTRNKVRSVNRKMSMTSSTTNSKLAEFINGLGVIRSFGLEKWSQDQYDEVVQDYKKAHLSANTFYSWSRPLISFLCGLPLVGLIGFGGHSVLSGAMGVGLFVTFIRYCERFINPIMMLAREFNVIQQAFTSAERVASFLYHAEENEVLGDDGVQRDSFLGRVRFQNVSMGYTSAKMILNNLSFDIQAGEKIGLVGRTGCGKSTTVSLLSRLYEFQKGEIFIDDISIRDFSREHLRSHIGFISQDVVLIKGSIRDNLCFDDQVSDEKILNACMQTGFSTIMQQSSINLDSHIVENGENLSTGQRQLLALTRILLRNPRLLIMDEATANIDEYYESIIQRAVDKIMQGRTCLIIAHRLKTLESCDRIFVFDKGSLVEEGAKDKLMQNKGHFYQLQNSSNSEVFH